MYKIAVISDTHNVLREEVLHELKTCNYILHAGDFVKQEILEQFINIGPFIGVKGNNDDLSLLDEEYFQISSFRFYMVHQKGKSKDTDFYIYGHSHQYACYKEEGIQYLNPGSCGRRRFSLPLTYAIIYLDDESYEIEKRIIDI